MLVEVNVAKATKTAIPELGKNEKTLHYLIIGTGEKKTVINVGEKTYNSVEKMLHVKQEETKAEANTTETQTENKAKTIKK